MWRELVRPVILQARFANIPEFPGFSRGEYVNNELINLTKGTIWQYSKGKLNKVYLNKTNIEKIMVNVSIAALTEVEL